MKRITHKAIKRMEKRAAKREWPNLIDIARVLDFAAWLSYKHEYMIQSPDAGEILRAWRHGETINVRYDGKRTQCGRHMMALWLTFECFYEGG